MQSRKFTSYLETKSHSIHQQHNKHKNLANNVEQIFKNFDKLQAIHNKRRNNRSISTNSCQTSAGGNACKRFGAKIDENLILIKVSSKRQQYREKPATTQHKGAQSRNTTKQRNSEKADRQKKSARKPNEDDEIEAAMKTTWRKSQHCDRERLHERRSYCGEGDCGGANINKQCNKCAMKLKIKWKSEIFKR